MNLAAPTGLPKVLVVGECLADLAPPSGTQASGTQASGTQASGTQASGTQASGAVAIRQSQPSQHLVAMPGGSPANVAVGLARLGLPAMFAGRFSNSGLGPWLREYLSANGVDLSLSVAADEPATIALVTLDGQGRASYTFYGPGTADWHWRPGELSSAADLAKIGVDAVHTGSLAAAFSPGAEALGTWLAELRQAGHALISFDPNMRPGLTGDFDRQRGTLTSMISNAHLVKASHEDVEEIFPGADVDGAAQSWLAGSALAVVITEGANGARLLHRNGFQVQGQPPSVEVVDTIGAGDSFTSGLLAHLGQQGLLNPEALFRAGQQQLADALSYALATSAMTCTRSGSDPPRASELEIFLTGKGPP